MTDAPNGIPVPDLMEASKGTLQKQLYVIFTTPTNGMGPVMENLEKHLAFQVALERDGIMFAAGPMWNDAETEWNGEGIVVVRAASRKAAEEIAASDPMHASGARSYRVRPWMINEGSINLRLDLSSQKVTII